MTLPTSLPLPDLLQDTATKNWQRLEDQLPVELLAQLKALPAAEKIIPCSDYVTDSLSRFPVLLTELLENNWLESPLSAAQLRVILKEKLSVVSTENDLHRVLRQFRRQMMTRIIWRDFSFQANMWQTTAELSHLADICVDEALNWLYDFYCPQWGTPYSRAEANKEPQPQRMIVIGMGKLGAYELNLSSDIDLMFCFPRHGQTQGGKRSLDNQDFFVRLGQKLIAALDNNTADGFVFRVDMRLRPYGQSGALSLSFPAMIDYYHDQGRDWERYAMIKARVIAGDLEAGNSLLEKLRPFVYRKYVDFSAIDSLRDMKEMINREVRRKGLSNNVKLGSGGIREVEFITQVFQLIRGGRDTELQERSIRKVLPIISGLGLLPQQVTDELLAAYLFLRNAEHALQGVADQQTQTLPDAAFAQARMAHIMNFPDWSAFEAELERQRAKVSFHFANVIAAPEDEEAGGLNISAELAALWQGQYDAESGAELLSAQGYEDASATFERITRLREGRVVQSMQREGRDRLEAFMPILLSAVTESETPSRTLERILQLVESVLRRSAYFVLLMENPAALKQLVKLCAASPWIAEHLARTPILLDELLNTATLYTPAEREPLRDELRQQLLRLPEEDEEAQMEALRYFKRAHVLRVAASDIMGTRQLMKVSDYLTFIAETILEQVLQMAWKKLTDKHGRPAKEDGTACDPAFIIVGYGKLGGIELGYGSDLDLVFLHDAAPQGVTDGERSIDNAVFFARLGQRIIHILNTMTSSGQLYEVDMRLRPSGNSGLLVSSLKSFKDYQQKEAWTWEKQALVRARVVAGCSELTEKFEQARAEILSEPRDIETLRQDVVSMRIKMRDNLGSKPEAGGERPLFHLKQDAGGMVDIEFIAQYSVLRYGAQHPELLQWTDNMRILETMQQVNILPTEQIAQLSAAYLAYRQAAHEASMQMTPSQVPSSQFVDYREAVSNIWHNLLES
ncbi:glutamate-ammonia-ligase adenylyltransferase [Oceanospirillum multiglobuliferum]|uniref:Bifunctional glutamine synthetase adenylyltransferase/adenylyl-removing enzyme n=1 Tax=Oceanospirillum multiglobuliferum TaxID=64969 RepID=A0A1T4Q8Q6_9GAMM|nr:bifunctional [glutamate--ammonia ligase]-adenylyl-L-tyrosine phosphorylase/[glutamate--ammonia-ligase] adenylyltransferase [Oceanospirillum multiglobuliferum]OPX56573.1 bifunctional glutamine synthetase adenylyltransferase/deadenyltransferase [Oceanospirillum multiglobuliferum]SKA00152.1 glutamate-ammonia-ligase adenylyltransferase [Oceanospirillum multiglobuliferum]